MKTGYLSILLLFGLLAGCANQTSNPEIDKIVLSESEKKIGNLASLALLEHYQLKNINEIKVDLVHYKDNKEVAVVSSQTLKNSANLTINDLYYSVNDNSHSNKKYVLFSIATYGKDKEGNDQDGINQVGLLFAQKYYNAKFMSSTTYSDKDISTKLEKNKPLTLAYYAVKATSNNTQVINYKSNEAMALEVELIK